MIIAWSYDNNFKSAVVTGENLSLLQDALWIDLISPTNEEEQWVVKHNAIQVPTKEKMREIELSSRLYVEGDILYMTATMIAQSLSVHPEYDAVTFILTSRQLVTIRYIEPQAFQVYGNTLRKSGSLPCSAVEVFISLLEVTVDRIADVLEYVGHHLDDFSNNLFRYDEEDGALKKNDYKKVMQSIGIKSNLNTKARESLATFTRLVGFVCHAAEGRIDSAGSLKLATINKDLTSLSDYTNFISGKINFLLDATLGMISIEQSTIIKIFSVAAVIFLPPTLIASIYGMNFKHIPELSWQWGYGLAISLMLLSAWLPYKFFKYKRWL